MEILRFKRIINGKTYNTETATQIAQYTDEDEHPYLEETLYKTRYGAYFLTWFNDLKPAAGIYPLEPKSAQEWMEKRNFVDAIEAEFGIMPEAGNKEARLTVRIPDSLHQRIAALAEAGQQSLNAWILRCLENGARATEIKGH